MTEAVHQSAFTKTARCFKAVVKCPMHQQRTWTVLHTTGAAHSLTAALQLALAVECSASADWRLTQMSGVMTRVIMPNDNSLQPIFQRKTCNPSCSVHRETNSLARSQKQYPISSPTLHFSHFQSDFKST